MSLHTFAGTDVIKCELVERVCGTVVGSPIESVRASSAI